jgi:glycosyltransferase involved in cell wall biosynthesis
MKITFVLEHADLAGGMRVVATYARLLKARGHEVTVVSTPRRPLKLADAARSLVRTGQLPRRYPENGPSHIDGAGVPHHRTRKYGPVTDRDVPDADVVIATWWETAEWVAALSPSKGAKAYLIQHHELTFEGQPADRVATTWRSPLHKIVISQWLKELATSTYDDADVSHVPNSVDTDQFNAPPRGKQAVPTVGMLYSTTPFKGCDVSLKAIEIVSKSFPNLQLVTFGSFNLEPHLALPAGSRYTYCPPQERIRDEYARCDVWMCGSRSEGFHLAPLEAMACRCPVVSTRVGGPMDTVREGVNGYLVDIDDASALAARLCDVLRLPEEGWRAMSDAAHVTATQYTWDDATTLFEAALQTAIEKSVARQLPPRSSLLAERDEKREVQHSDLIDLGFTQQPTL